MGELGVKYSNLDEIRKYAHIDRIDSRSLAGTVSKKPERPEAKTLETEGAPYRLLPIDPDQ